MTSPTIDPLTEHLFYQALSAAVPVAVACDAAGISHRTFRRWMVQGLEEAETQPGSPLARFARRMEEAQALAENEQAELSHRE